MKTRTVRMALSIGSGALLTAALSATQGALGSQSTSPVVSMATDKARYVSGEPVKLQVSVTNPSAQTVTGDVYVSAYHLSQHVVTLTPQPISVPPKTSSTVTLTWHPPNQDYLGYQVNGVFQQATGSRVEHFGTAVDVSSDWTKFPRYGFVSDYPQMSKAAVLNELTALKDYHIDGLQFYDWQWKHHVPLAGSVAHPAETWQDIAARTNTRQTILNMIRVGHQLNIKSFNYNLLYGAWAGYQTDGSGVNPAWGLYSNGSHLQVNVGMPGGWSTSAIDVFNPANPSWRQYILNQEANVFKAYPFDGWQVDQLGDQGLVYDAKGGIVDLQSTFTPFLNTAANELHKQVIFNNVGGYGLADVVAHSKESIAYVETWPSSGQVTLDDLKSTIDSVNSLSKGKKSTVLAAYLDSNYANGFSADNPGSFDAAGVLLADATIFASGGDHLELGDNLQMLNAPYFPNHNLVMDNSLKAKVSTYYNFMVAYENLLRGGLTNTTSAVVLKGQRTSNGGDARTIWTFTKRGQGYDVIQLINLLGQANTLWQDSDANKTVALTLHHLQVKYYGRTQVRNVYLASPDLNEGVSTALKFSEGHDGKGHFISFTLPSLAYWDMIYMSTR